MNVEDGTGSFLVFAGQYSPEALDTMRSIEPPEYVLVYGKVNEFRPDDDESEVIVTVDPDTVSVVDKDERDLWVTQTAEQTIQRMESRQEGEYGQQATEQYGEVADNLRDNITSALEGIE
jgi:Uncharacterized protein conserved in archaea